MSIPPGSLYFSLDAADPASYPGSGSTWTDTESSIAVTLSGTSFVSDFGGAITFPTAATGSFPVNASFPLGADPVTINMWIKFNALPGSYQDPLFVIGNPSFNDCHYLFLLPDGALGFSGNIVYDMAGPLRADFGPLYSVDNKYHQLTTTYDGATMKSYWDGQFIPNSNFSNVGALTAYSTGYIGFFNGNSTHASFTISQLELYDNGFSALEVEELYNIQSLRYENVVASYDFSNTACYPGTGNTVFDLSESNLDLPISGATYAGTGQSKYFSFDGSDYIGAKNLNLLPSDNTFSMNIWARKNSQTSGATYFLLSIGANPGPSGTNPYITANEYTEKYSVQFSNGIGAVISTEEVPNSVWNMITYTADGTNSKIYIDGVLTGTASQGIGSNPASNATLYIGAVTDGSNDPLVTNRFTGDVALVDIYSVALSAGDVTTIYNNEVSRFGSPPPAYQGIVGGRQFAQGFNG